MAKKNLEHIIKIITLGGPLLVQCGLWKPLIWYEFLTQIKIQQMSLFYPLYTFKESYHHTNVMCYLKFFISLTFDQVNREIFS